MKNWPRRILFFNATFLPGEMGFISAIMVTQYTFSLPLLICFLGMFITINCYIACCPVAGAKDKKQERILD